MIKKLLFLSYCIFSGFSFVFILAGWVAGSHGHLFGNRSEAIKILLILGSLIALPILVYYVNNSLNPSKVYLIGVLTLLLIQLSIVCYFLFLVSLDPISIALMLLLMAVAIVFQMILIIRKLRHFN